MQLHRNFPAFGPPAAWVPLCWRGRAAEQARVRQHPTRCGDVRVVESRLHAEGGFTAEAFSRYFTPDAVMRITARSAASASRIWRNISAISRLERDGVIGPALYLDEFSSSSGPDLHHHFVRAREPAKESRERSWDSLQSGPARFPDQFRQHPGRRRQQVRGTKMNRRERDARLAGENSSRPCREFRRHR